MATLCGDSGQMATRVFVSCAPIVPLIDCATIRSRPTTPTRPAQPVARVNRPGIAAIDTAANFPLHFFDHTAMRPLVTMQMQEAAHALSGKKMVAARSTATKLPMAPRRRPTAHISSVLSIRQLSFDH